MNTNVNADVAGQAEEVLVLEDIRKRFGGITALDGASLHMRRGEIHGLVGENGAGKSTLIKALCGIIPADSGTMVLEGEAFNPQSPRDAKRAGVQVVHQELSLMSELTVAENVCFEYLPRLPGGVLNRAKMNEQARAAIDRVGLSEVPVTIGVKRLGIAHRQLLEIARAVSNEGRILVLDEPTATLTSYETARLFELLHELVSDGVSILLVSHHLDEILEHCDQVTVMRNGATVLTKPIAETDTEDLIQAMVGRRLGRQLETDAHREISDEVALSVRGLRHAESKGPDGVSFDLHKGEILGVAGLVGAGRTEIMRALFGIDRALAGEVSHFGEERHYRAPVDAISDGIAFVTEDRRDEGLILAMSIASNVSLASLDQVSRFGLLDKKSELTLTKRMAERLRLKYGGPADPASSLSGGNQQKVVLAKWLAREPDILLLDEPPGVSMSARRPRSTICCANLPKTAAH